MPVVYGATLAEWEAFSRLDLRNLLPYVADPDVPQHPRSRVKPASKTPSFVYQGQCMGFLEWNDPTKATASTHDWQRDPRLGICLRTQNIKAIDIDVPDIALAKEIEAYIRETLGGFDMPLRSRAGTGKRALLYRLVDNECISKYMLHVDKKKGIIEFLGDKHQLCVAGGYPTGGRYEWPEGIPTALSDIPAFHMADILALSRSLATDFGPTGWYREWRYQTEYTPRSYKAEAFDEHPAVKFIIENDWFVDYANNNGIYVRCPWANYHSSESGPTEAEFFPGTKEHPEHGFKCMHAHSLAPGGPFDPNATEFLQIIGYRAEETKADFSVLAQKPDAPVLTRPKFTYKGKTTKIEPNLPNTVAMLRWTEGTSLDVRLDRFKEAILYRNGTMQWLPLTDETYTGIRLKLMGLGLDAALNHEMIHKALHFVAFENEMDSAQEWLNSLVWDGVPRIDTFHRDALKLADDPYYIAACQYLWTALAGRITEPGCKADMVPILVGAQGLRKSSVVEAIAPSKDEYSVVSLADRDENLARQLRGRMVVEWDELRGLHTKDSESIKGWISRTKDDWIPKYKELPTSMLRRYMLIGTANPKQFLNDSTGLRRWLPLFITSHIDVDYVIDMREQLWAEGKVRYLQHKRDTNGRSGVMYERAEELSKAAQKKASIRDPWVDAVLTWIEQEDRSKGATTIQVLHQACSIATSQITFGTHDRLRRTMAYIGWEENEQGLWQPPLA